MTRDPRNLVLVLGDQLDEHASALDGFDPGQDAIWMAEVAEESTHIASSKQRSTVFLSAMRHFSCDLRDKGWPVHYSELDAAGNSGSLAGELEKAILELRPKRLVMTAPGEWRVLERIRATARKWRLDLEIRDDRHFFSTVRDFSRFAEGRKQLRLEHFYREMRRKTGILMDGTEPVGAQWNFDTDNRSSFGRHGPGELPKPAQFAPDTITRDVMNLVTRRLAKNPGAISDFGWPVTRSQALQALSDFISHRLPNFGPFQDAMWEGEAWLYHSRLSCALNLNLLNPREVISAAENEYRAGRAPLQSVEGFVRQILGWREYVRGVYWTSMPEYASRNAFDAHAPLPGFYWTGETDMACLRDAIRQTLEKGYAHHIQRLMVTGLYALLLGVRPRDVHEWYLGVYVDAVEWVELPNTLGMSQFADGGLMASKPYVASGKYIHRMSNHCEGCRFDPARATGETACPFTTLYWDFLIRHSESLSKNPRMLTQLKNLARLSDEERRAISNEAGKHRAKQATPNA